MRNAGVRSLIAVVGFIVASKAAPVFAEPSWTLAHVKGTSLFVPSGFDDNDEVEVVVDGYLPNSCYQMTTPTAQVDSERKVITVFPQARVHSGMCLQVLVPYNAVVKIGNVPKGSYQVKTWDGALNKQLIVAQSREGSPDDHHYAPVDHAYVEYLPAQGHYVIRIEGRYTNTCMRWGQTKVITKADNVVEVLPILNYDDSEPCEEREMPYKGVTEVLPDMPEGRYLLHVRSLNGSSRNEVFSIGAAQP